VSAFTTWRTYWAGPRDGYRYEFSRGHYPRVFVRYLPKGVPTGAGGAKYLIVATYPYARAFAVLTKQAEGRAVAGPGGSIVYVSPSDPRSVYMAFPEDDYEIEVYDPSPAVALATAMSGDIQPVG